MILASFLLSVSAFAAAIAPAQEPAQLADVYVRAVKELNDDHARKPVAKTEEELAKKLPKRALEALQELVSIKGGTEELAEALERMAEAALDLARMDDFELARTHLARLSPERAKKLGIAIARPRFLARGTDGVEAEGLKQLADAFERVLDGYDEVFGLTNFSKVPAKKLRLRAHLVETIERPPHFAPQFPWHSEIDFPVIDARVLASPTKDGKFLFYGLCHELGHVIAMWGDTSNEEDHHAWAHYTGVAVCEHVAKEHGNEPALKELRDAQWRSIESAREESKKTEPAERKEYRESLTLLLALHDAAGPKAIGAALNALDAANKNQRVNRVRYYRFKDFREALLVTPEGKKHRKEVLAAFGG